MPLLFLSFYTQSVLANTCVNAFSRLQTLKTPKIVQKMQRLSTHARSPQEVRDVLNISGLKPEEIEGLNILNTAEIKSFPVIINDRTVITNNGRIASYHRAIVNYLRNVFGARSVFSLTENKLDRALSERALTTREISRIKTQLGENLSDITLAVRKFEAKPLTDTATQGNDPASMRQWLENLTKVTEPGGLIIINVSRSGNNNHISSRVFESILAEIQTTGTIEAYAQHHANRHSKKLLTFQYNHLNDNEVFLGGLSIGMSIMGPFFLTLLALLPESHPLSPFILTTGGLLTSSAFLTHMLYSMHSSHNSITYKIINGSSQHLKDQINEAY